MYLDDHLVAVYKPSGLLVHRTGLERNARFFALQLLRDRLGERVYPLRITSYNVCYTKLLRLSEPQLPIYASEVGDDQVAAVLFAQVRGGDCRFRGLAARDDDFPKVRNNFV